LTEAKRLLKKEEEKRKFDEERIRKEVE